MDKKAAGLLVLFGVMAGFVWGCGTVEKVRPKLRLGLAYVAPNPGTISLDISQTIRADYAPEVAAGYEIKNKELSFRCGIADDGLTAGAGFQGEHARVDYAYVTQRALSKDNVHRISLSGVW